jgi:hypothetical protein
MLNLRLSVPREFRREGKADNEVESVASGQDLIKPMCRNLGKATLAETDVLDRGCGTKLVQAIPDTELPVRIYVGIDVHTPLIEFLKVNVTDDRFTFSPLIDTMKYKTRSGNRCRHPPSPRTTARAFAPETPRRQPACIVATDFYLIADESRAHQYRHQAQLITACRVVVRSSQ